MTSEGSTLLYIYANSKSSFILYESNEYLLFYNEFNMVYVCRAMMATKDPLALLDPLEKR